MITRKPLSPREREVLQLLSYGARTADIADILGISPKTTAGYLSTIYRKLHVSNRVQAVMIVGEL